MEGSVNGECKRCAMAKKESFVTPKMVLMLLVFIVIIPMLPLLISWDWDLSLIHI